MDRKQLLGFTRIMAVGSLAKAAKSLYVSESALSRQIMMLEDKLDLKLFSRRNRQLVPTPEGIAFLPEAERVLMALDQLRDIASDISRNPHLRFHVVTVQRMANAVAVPAVRKLRRLHPNYGMSIEIESFARIQRWVSGKQFDIAITPLPIHDKDVHSIKIASVPMVAVVPKNHPLARRDQVELNELRDENLSLTVTGSVIRRQIESLFTQTNVKLHPDITVSDTRMASQMVAEGYGVTISDPFAPATFKDKVAVVPIAPGFNMEFGAISLGENDHPILQDFLSLLKETAQEYLTEINILS